MIDQHFLLCTTVIGSLTLTCTMKRYHIMTQQICPSILPLPFPLSTHKCKSICSSNPSHPSISQLTNNQTVTLTSCRDADVFLIPLTRIGSGGNGHQLCISSTLTFTSISCLVARMDHISGRGITSSIRFPLMLWLLKH